MRQRSGSSTPPTACTRCSRHCSARTSSARRPVPGSRRRSSRLHESDAQLAAVVEQLSQLTAQGRAASAEADRLTRVILTAEAAQAANAAELASLEERVAAAEAAADIPDGEPDPAERDRLVSERRQLRSAETDARLAVRTVEERVRALVGRAESLDRTAASERAARERAVIRLARRERERAVAAAVVDATPAGARLPGELAPGGGPAARRCRPAPKRPGDRARGCADARAGAGRGARPPHRLGAPRRGCPRRAAAAHRAARDASDRGARRRARHPAERVRARVPRSRCPPTSGEPITIPYVREEQEKRLRGAERALALLGRVNPLALEEFAALEERHGSSPTSSRTSRRPGATCSTSSREVDERVERGRSPPPSTTPRASSSTSSAGCSPAARGGSSSPNPTTCSPPASRSRPGRRARRSSGCRCCPAASAR